MAAHSPGLDSMVVNEAQESMLRQLFLKPLSATAVRSDPHDAAGPSTLGFDFGGPSCGSAGDAPPFCAPIAWIPGRRGKKEQENLDYLFVLSARLV